MGHSVVLDAHLNCVVIALDNDLGACFLRRNSRQNSKRQQGGTA
jgi:hypothetical protein